ncbi:polysaccharide deacetylase family protein [Heyndrickxia sp. NPDC080065]|uniref:polysaccharide deacetylase family protein n=1 Tax=Heyndrickxia sp. NPDC080065 TaxID=3390568 RepID=UPI003D071473
MVFDIAFFLIIFYMIIPYILSFIVGWKVFRKGKEQKEVAFTFDDGPDPTYTEKLLNLLAQYQIKATFFVVGSKAEKYPELILRMHNEGHLIGIHNYVHHSNWLMLPWKIKNELKQSALTVEKITGIKPTYYRPPWGLLNLFDFFIHKDFHIVLWSLMVGDWRIKGGSERISRNLLAKIQPGDVVLLHDSGETLGANSDAPYYTIEALKTVFKELKHQGYIYRRIDNMIIDKK